VGMFLCCRARTCVCGSVERHVRGGWGGRGRRRALGLGSRVSLVSCNGSLTQKTTALSPFSSILDQFRNQLSTMAAICNVAARASAAPKVSVRATSKVQVRAFLGRADPLKAQVAGTSPPVSTRKRRIIFFYSPTPTPATRSWHPRGDALDSRVLSPVHPSPSPSR
jgi:hypothetical protein